MTTETASAVTLPGGEMLAWSDRTDPADDGPLARGWPPAWCRPARVLLAGPHGPAVLDALAHTRLTCLLRGYPDATAVADGWTGSWCPACGACPLARSTTW